ncbi:MAG: hypothetical protein JWM68_4702 [Verrucomicrobiales bacterium]|nr:hypothetical protein [Verrucomicrobiales bacterium]
MREYEIYVPLHFNDGTPVEWQKLQGLKARLVEQFGGLTHFPQQNEGLWKVGEFTFRDHVVILRVLSQDSVKSERFFARLKKEIKRDWQQEDVLIVARDVKAL